MSLPDPARKEAAVGALAAPPVPPLASGARYWPGPEERAGRRALLGAAGAGLVGAAAMVVSRPGLGWLLVALAVGTVAVVVARRPPTPATLAEPAPVSVRTSGTALWGGAALALVAVAAIRDAGYLVAICVAAAVVAGSLALAGGRTVGGLAAGACAGTAAVFRALPWAGRALSGYRAGRGQARVAVSMLVTLALVTVFATLFASADHTFARVLDAVLPTVDPAVGFQAVLRFLLIGLIALATGYLAAGRPRFDQLPPAVPRQVRRAEWVLPLVAVDAVFLGFVAVQVATVAGGPPDDGDYARYARAGFWQLDVVTVLTLLVLGVAARVAPRVERVDRLLLRVLLGTLAGCALAIVASAIRRLSLYEEAYGFTRLRVLVGAVELWLGVVFLLVILVGVRLRGGWLPRAVLGTGLAALLVVAAVNPDGFIADRNVDRYLRTGDLDTRYLSTLSLDAVPALDRLPAGPRDCALWRLYAGLDDPGDDWRSWNLDRQRARTVLTSRPASPTVACFR
jgi:hypothetical protein